MFKKQNYIRYFHCRIAYIWVAIYIIPIYCDIFDGAGLPTQFLNYYRLELPEHFQDLISVYLSCKIIPHIYCI